MNGKVTPNHNGEVKNLPLEHVDPADLNQEGSKAALCDDSNDCETGNPKVGYSVYTAVTIHEVGQVFSYWSIVCRLRFNQHVGQLTYL